jgi:hypothetical protein
MIALVLSLSLAGPVEQGAIAWEQGAIDEAIAAWTGALDHGRGSATLHTNLGVAWYRRGDPARAVAHWRMARVLSPRDGDAAHNLAVVRAEIEGAPPPVGGLPPALQLATVGEYGVLGAISLLTASVGAWVARARRGSVLPWLGVAAVGAIFAAACLTGLHDLEHHPGAVVVDREVALRVDPDPAAPVVRRLPPGAELRVERAVGDFVLLAPGEGARGWAPRASVAVVGHRLDLPVAP